MCVSACECVCLCVRVCVCGCRFPKHMRNYNLKTDNTMYTCFCALVCLWVSVSYFRVDSKTTPELIKTRNARVSTQSVFQFLLDCHVREYERLFS